MLAVQTTCTVRTTDPHSWHQVDEKLTVEAVRAVLAERWQDPALAATSSRELSRELQVGTGEFYWSSAGSLPSLHLV